MYIIVMSHENYIINPLNNRLIRKGFSLHRKLIKEGVIVHDFENDDNILCVLEENMDVGSLKEMYDERLKESNYHSVIGRGMYRGYLVKKKKRSKRVDYTNKKMKEVVKQVHKKILVENITNVDTLEAVCITNSKNKYDVKPNQKGKNKYYIEL